ncbi:MAG: flagellar motor switch protein FliG, partial [Pseudomonadota bacterium]
MDDKGLEDAAILLISMGEEGAADVFRHLTPKEVERLIVAAKKSGRRYGLRDAAMILVA